MTKVVNDNKKIGVISQLHSMLTNHMERPEFLLNISLRNKNNKEIDSGKFLIYANEPVSKITQKVSKLREKGGYPTLVIRNISQLEENEYLLELII